MFGQRSFDTYGPTTRVSDRHLTEEVGMQRGAQTIKTAWQTRWLVAVHLDPMVRCPECAENPCFGLLDNPTCPPVIPKVSAPRARDGILTCQTTEKSWCAF